MTPRNEKHLSELMQYLRVDKGLAANTLMAYTRDLSLFFRFIEENSLTLETVAHENITDFLWAQKKTGKSPATLIRYIESIRQLYRFLISESRMENDPTIILDLRRRPERWPTVLAVHEMNRLLPDPTIETIRSL